MIAAFDHPFLSGLLGDDEVGDLLGVEAEIAAMTRFEAALATAQARCGVISEAAASAIGAAAATFSPDMAALRAATTRDGVAGPEFVRQLRAAVGEPHAASVHFGATSQDVVDTALVLRVKPVLAVMERRLRAITAKLEELTTQFGSRRMMGHTRMQAAIPVTVADRLTAWRSPLLRHLERLEAVRASILVVQFGGAAGSLDKYGGEGPAVRAALSAELGLGDAPQWQSQRDRVADLAGWLSLVSGSLGKIGQDIALMALQATEIKLAGGGASSAMTHKQNPVKAEILVALARFNAAQLGGFHQSLVHEHERSGAAWTLEWMILPLMLVATAAALRSAANLLHQVCSLGTERS